MPFTTFRGVHSNSEEVSYIPSQNKYSNWKTACHIKPKSLCKLNSRSSHPEVFCKKGVLRNFAKFTGKHLKQSFFFNKVADLRPATLLKKRLLERCFPVKFAKFLRTPFLTEHLCWLLLKFLENLLLARYLMVQLLLIILRYVRFIDHSEIVSFILRRSQVFY